jgi:hypothetical protein
MVFDLIGGVLIRGIMSEPPEDDSETPIQRALRLKQAAIDARPKPPRLGKFQRQQAAALGSGKSKPWMKR